MNKDEKLIGAIILIGIVVIIPAWLLKIIIAIGIGVEYLNDN